jgi:hypothetical protein
LKASPNFTAFWSWASGSGRDRTAKPERFLLPPNPPFCLTGGAAGRLGSNGSIRRADLRLSN